MTHTFYKYQGSGNDFIIIDNRALLFDKSKSETIAKWCDRRFGIGADGLILLENHSTLDFKMVYFNADGNESSMCGNGGRCIVKFAAFLKIIKTNCEFEAIDGPHSAILEDNIVKLKMQNVSTIEIYQNHQFLNTGSPHHVEIVDNLQNYDVKSNGHRIRYGSLYKQQGANINFVSQVEDNIFAVRTYERGVEDETLSCGTGVTAVALAMHKTQKTFKNHVKLKTIGGDLEITFNTNLDGTYSDIWLIGPAKQVFKGEISW